MLPLGRDLRVVGLMASFAGKARAVSGVNLRERFWFGGAGGVAADAKNQSIEFGRLNGGGIIGVRGECAVASLAIHAGVLSPGFHIQDIGMARLASLVACKDGLLGRDFRNGVAAILAVLAKAARYENCTNYDEENCNGKKDQNEAQEMFSVFELSHLSFVPPAIISAFIRVTCGLCRMSPAR